MCERTGLFPKEQCHKPIAQARRAPRPHDDVTWEQLKEADPHFAKAAMILAHRYGYDDVLPLMADGLDDDQNAAEDSGAQQKDGR